MLCFRISRTKTAYAQNSKLKILSSGTKTIKKILPWGFGRTYFFWKFFSKVKKYTHKIGLNKGKNCYVSEFPEPKPRMLRSSNWKYFQLALKQSRKDSLEVLGGLSFSGNFSGKPKNIPIRLAKIRVKIAMFQIFPEPKLRMLKTPNFKYFQLALKQSRKDDPGVLEGLSFSENFCRKSKIYAWNWLK